MKRSIIGILVLVHGVLLWGQAPMTVPLDHNPVLQQEKSMRVMTKRAPLSVDPISLPFLDDFSYYPYSPYPDPSLWMDDRCVFVNNDFPRQPRSNGVATFDALDAEGSVYKNSAASFYADSLTSRPIDLGGTGMDNVYLSFFYQPQGYGDSPETGDSLILQFRSQDSKKWRKVWSVPGTTVHSFKQVMIALSQENLYKGFQFRFINIVSLDPDKSNLGRKGNVDQWHIDYIRMDKDRNENDTAMVDVAMIAPIKSLIKGYQSIPWEQFKIAYASRLEPQISITYRNNDNKGYLVTRLFEVTDVYNHQTTPIGNGGAENIRAGQIITYNEDALNPFDSPSRDSALFELKGYLKTDDYDRKENDTVHFYQVFKNYFARDDGIPESGYGYEGINVSGSAIACRYETFMPDTLRAIQLFFNSVSGDVTSKYGFQIAVWKDDNGRPGDPMYLSSQEYSPEKTGCFTTYMLEKPLYVTKYYWIGWKQTTNGFLNVGLDLNYNDKGNLWYNSSGFWQQDASNGTLMIRPMVGKRSDFPTSSSSDIEIFEKNTLIVHPNPASEYIRVKVENTEQFKTSEYNIEIYDRTGRLRYWGVFSEEYIDVSGFEQGLYILRLVPKKTGRTHIQKILISR